MENLKSKHYFNVVSTRLFFHVKVSSLEHRHKKQENVLMTILEIQKVGMEIRGILPNNFFYKIFEKEFIFNRAKR